MPTSSLLFANLLAFTPGELAAVGLIEGGAAALAAADPPEDGKQVQADQNGCDQQTVP